jgi:hypothetical protein
MVNQNYSFQHSQGPNHNLSVYQVYKFRNKLTMPGIPYYKKQITTVNINYNYTLPSYFAYDSLSG